MSRPFRFGVSLVVSAPADEWSAKCRRAEELGVRRDPGLNAEVAAFTSGRTPQRTGRLTPITAEELDERGARCREPAADRAEPAELNLLIRMVDVTEGREAASRPFLGRVPHLTPGQEQLRARRERYGFTCLTALEPYMEAFAPVMRAVRED
ncbi:hypothetical protein ACF07W_35240 [Streptomyces sp. NPDC015140]|uniref:hypothetical protein n=1 Tax=Streptomyces sp. NPDC015140 TaxID=3364943 RepID=UPI003700DAF6